MRRLFFCVLFLILTATACGPGYYHSSTANEDFGEDDRNTFRRARNSYVNRYYDEITGHYVVHTREITLAGHRVYGSTGLTMEIGFTSTQPEIRRPEKVRLCITYRGLLKLQKHQRFLHLLVNDHHYQYKPSHRNKKHTRRGVNQRFYEELFYWVPVAVIEQMAAAQRVKGRVAGKDFQFEDGDLNYVRAFVDLWQANTRLQGSRDNGYRVYETNRSPRPGSR